ncbi:MAG: (4Fe-4S)-binding protein [Candidatus Neomarinimicrobiota bacterium]|nr:MAG: (4Fe-4S)-binding protein [Candidatus Neomarinimicrobiota bacterium]
MDTKQITIISGKGGTGKTSFISSLAVIVDNKITVDCDVDAANLHLLLKPEIVHTEAFKSGKTFTINNQLCTECGKCVSVCRFNAIRPGFTIDQLSCEHCGLCERICPVGAITSTEKESGEWFISKTQYGTLIHARLKPGEENSGKLVAKIRQVARERAGKKQLKYILIDGPPGTGCPVIASITGVDMVIVVTEPSMSGLHDLSRVLNLTNHFRITPKVVINKYDINHENTKLIEAYCQENNVEVIAKIPYSREIIESIVNGTPPILNVNGEISQEIKSAWEKVEKSLMHRKGG